MVLNLSDQNNAVAKMIADELSDDVVTLDAGAAEADVPLHSGKAYIFVLDCNSLTNKMARDLITTQFTGSKVLYCLFLSAVDAVEIDEMAKKVSEAKGFVLFGYDNLSVDAQGLPAEGEKVRLQSAIERIRTYRPFENETFPYYA